jgi:hypothetical protein
MTDNIEKYEDFIDLNLVELHIDQKNWDEVDKFILEISEGKSEEEINENPHIYYIKAKKEIKLLNLRKAKTFLEQALNFAQSRELSSLLFRILSELLRLVLFNLVSQAKGEEIIESRNLIRKLKEIVIKINQENKFISILDQIEEKTKQIPKLENQSEISKFVLNIHKDVNKLILLYSDSKLMETKDEIIFPNQLIILHRSGIPIKRYIKEMKIVDDVLLFGGMVRAAKDIISEVFTAEIGKVMEINYGEEIKILAEFGGKETGIVLITRKDTFHQRRALHESVIELNKLDFPSQYYGELLESIEKEIDTIIEQCFGEGYQGEK